MKRRAAGGGRRAFLRSCGTHVATLVLLTVTSAARLGAQAPPERARPSTVRPELRLDYLGGRTNGVHVGAGLSVRAGNYVRAGASAGAGTGDRAHANVTARFMLDPFRQSRVGVSLGGGVSVRMLDEGARAFALLIADVEFGRRRGWTPFVSGGIGGGPRAAFGVRRGAATGR